MFHKFTIILLLTVLSLRPAYFVGNVVYYETHLSEIIEKYCVNKDKPELQCNGQCHLAKEISPVSNTDKPDAVANVSTAFFPVFYQELLETNILVVTIEPVVSCFNYDFRYHYLMSTNIHKPPMV